MASSILLRGGTLIVHEAGDKVKAIQADLLIEGNKIVKIEQGIAEPTGTEVIDCQDKIISPGFIDTHHHVWQTQLKGRHADHNLIEYMPTGNLQSSNYETPDIFWGQLGGCLEALDAGTTSIVDHAHLTTTPEAARAAVSATVSSGIRSVYGYTPITRVASWNPLTFHENALEPWVIETFEELARNAPYANGRVQIGLAFDLWFLPKEVLQDLFGRAKKHGVKTVTAHLVDSVQFPAGYIPGLIDSYGLLDSQMIFSHSNNISPEATNIIKNRGAHVSCTPSTELQMGLGPPAAFANPVLFENCSLGIDCHSNNSSSIPAEMRLGLQAARGFRNQRFIDAGKAPKKIEPSVEQVFNMGTIHGARALGMEDQLGSIAVGKLADLVIFDKTTPAMVCAAEHDPVVAIVMHSTQRDIDAVIVDGILRKRAGALVDVEVEKEATAIVGETKLAWKQVAKELVKSRARIQSRINGTDWANAEDTLLKMFQIDASLIVDSP